MKKGLRLWLLLSIIFSTTLLITNTVLYVLMLHENTQRIQKEERTLLVAIGKQLALENEVKQALINQSATPALENHTLKLAEIHGLDFIVVMNMDGIRLTHPNQQKIGQPFVGGDEKTALNGKNHVSISNGTLGRSLRGFVPVFDHQRQIGVVALGITLTSLDTLIKESNKQYALSLIIILVVGFTVASLVAYYLKRQLLNLEPKEITKLLEERNAMLNETKDVVVVTDNKNIITLANIAASSFYYQLSGHKESLEGQPLQVLLQHHEQLDFQRKTEQLYRQNGQDYLFYSAPISVRKQTIGSINFLRNATESLVVMDQLANTTAYASALQSQSHEFMNKLHVIYGLADLGAYDELAIYLKDILRPEQKFSQQLAILVKNPLIAGFLVGEREKFAERKTNLAIEFASELPNHSSQEKTIAIINLYRYIHHTLLQWPLPDTLPLTITYKDNSLLSCYTLVATPQTLANWQHGFHEHYFAQLLQDAAGTFAIEQHDTAIVFHLTTTYKGETK